MTFRDAITGYDIYILDRNAVQISQEKIVSVSVPHLDSAMPTINKMVVDIRTNSGATYTMPDSADVAYVGDKVLTTDQSRLLPELDTIRKQAERSVAEVDTQKERIIRCNNLIAEINPAMKDKKETDARLDKLENSVSDIKVMLSDINNKLMTKI